MVRYSFFTLLFVLLFSRLFGQNADIAFINGKIYTANEDQPFVEAMAILDNEILYVGDEEGLQEYLDFPTSMYDLEGKLVIPGILDVHQHPLEASSPVFGDCLLDPYDNIPQLVNTLEACNLQPNSNGWLLAFGHSIFSVMDAPQPSRFYLDQAYPDDPLVVYEETSHSMWVNTKALELLGIDENTPDPVGGHIYKNPNTGQVDGILMDNAGDLALEMALASNPSIDQQNYQGLIDFGLPLLARNGITTAVEARTYTSRNYIDIWKQVRDNDQLTCRVHLAPWIYPEAADADQIPFLASLYEEGDFLSVQQLKCYSDGLVQNATAALIEPYNNNWDLPFDQGLNYIDLPRLTNLITELEPVGFDFIIHAIGDRGVTEGLDAIEAAQLANGELGRRHRLTHLEIVHPDDLSRFATLKVIADMQVAGWWTQPNYWNLNVPFVGAQRANNLIPLKFLEEAEATITLSSDWDVSTVNPFVGIENAVRRTPQEISSVEMAVKAYTIQAAYALGREAVLGSLEAGKWADFIILDQDLFTIPENDISQTKVLSTWVNGQEVWNDFSFVVSAQEPNASTDTWTIRTNRDHHHFIVEVHRPDLSALEIYTLEGDLVRVFNGLGRTQILVNTLKYPAGTYLVTGLFKNGQRISELVIVTK